MTEVVRGHQVSQALASLRVDDKEIVTVSAALGRRTLDVSGSWARRPEVPPPQDCPERPLSRRYRGTIADRIHARLARGRPPSDFPGPPGDGRSALWLQVADLEQGAGLMAIIGDYVPFGISQATGRPAGGNSLDNTLRVVDAGTASGWILADVEVYAVARGFAHGRVHLWSEDGRLLATATQSAMVRLWDEEGRPVRSA